MGAYSATAHAEFTEDKLPITNSGPSQQVFYEVKCYDLVVIDFTPKHAEADITFARSSANFKTLTRVHPNGQRVVLQRHPQG